MFTLRFRVWWSCVSAPCLLFAANGCGSSSEVGGSGGGDGGTCPAMEPTIGSACAPAGRLNCSYGSNPCCGGAYTCGTDGKWQALGLGCACMPPDAGAFNCAGTMCAA